MGPVIYEVGLLNPVYCPKNVQADVRFRALGHIFEWYWDFGQASYKVARDSSEGIVVERNIPQKSWKRVAGLVVAIFFKLITLLTGVIPFFMFLGKCFYRSENQFLLLSSNHDGHVRERFRYDRKKIIDPDFLKYQEIINGQHANEKQQIQLFLQDHYANKNIIDENLQSLRKRIEDLEIDDFGSLGALLNLYRQVSHRHALIHSFLIKQNESYSDELVQNLKVAQVDYAELLTALLEKFKDNQALQNLYRDFQGGLGDIDDISEEDLDLYVALTSMMKALPIINPEEAKPLINEELLAGALQKLAPHGIQNCGNSCYLNSDLQAIMSVPFFRDRLLGDWSPWEFTQEPKETVQEYQARRLMENARHLSQAQVFGGFKKIFSKFTRYYDEKNKKLIDSKVRKLRDNLKKVGVIEGVKTSQQDARRILSELLSATGYSLKTRTKISFNRNDERVEVEMPLSFRESIFNIPLRDVVGEDSHGSTMQELIDHKFTPKHYVDPDYIHQNENIIERDEIEIFEEIPDYLVINISRFGVAENKFEIKYDDKIQFPEGEQIDFTRAFDEKLLQPGQAVRYEVQAVVTHHGRTPLGGHYTADVKKGGGWYRCDDGHITKLGVSNPDMGSGYLYVLKKVP